MENKYAGKEEGPSAIMCIEEEKISLTVPQSNGIPDNTWEKNGWELTPVVRPPTVRNHLWSNIMLNISYSSAIAENFR